MQQTRDEWDVVVLGSGAAGLTAAFTAADAGAKVAVYERADAIGGTSAWSGGYVWITNNSHAAEIGVSDSRAEALDYLHSLGRGILDENLVTTFVDRGPEMISYLDERAGTAFYAVHTPDYHPERPGGKPLGGRSMETPLFSFHELGDWADRVTRTPYRYASSNALSGSDGRLTSGETPLGALVPQLPSRDELQRRIDKDERSTGQSLVGRLLKACLDAGVQVFTSTRGREVIMEDGQVIGVRVDTPEGEIDVHAHRGVILACGGFEWNEDYKRTFLRGPLTHPVSVPTNTGDGLYMAMKAGAMLEDMREAWWIPVVELPDGVNATNRFMLNGDRARPRTIMVNRYGRRFANEAANYNAFGGAFHHEDPVTFDYINLPSWMIFDHGYLRRYGAPGAVPPSENPPTWLTAYPTIEALAEGLGVPIDTLQETISRWNKNVADGHDPDFHRGESAYERWLGDRSYDREIGGTLGPIDAPPYFAMQVYSGALGTKGGPRVNENACVVDLDGNVIAGLYAAGNTMGSALGPTYGGAGGTLGPAMTFGYLAGGHAAGRITD